jgi:hypothetical protein
MTFDDFTKVFQTPFLKPWEHDYYEAVFDNSITDQEFLDHAHLSIQDLSGLWFRVGGNTSYFIVPKGTIIPENFATVTVVTGIPEQPTQTEE